MKKNQSSTEQTEKTKEKTKKRERFGPCLMRVLARIPLKRTIAWICGISRKGLRWMLRLGKRLLPVCGLLLLTCALAFGCFFAISAAVCNKTDGRIVSMDALEETGEKFDCILVLGCRVNSDGSLSHMLEDRVMTAVALYRSGVADTLLMSGDSQDPSYDETGAMKARAIAEGVPEDAILTDPLGLSTYDSVSRLSEQYPSKRVLIVTQEYHLYRALYISEKLGVEAYGVSADLRTYRGQIKYDFREIFARCKDVYYALRV